MPLTMPRCQPLSGLSNNKNWPRCVWTVWVSGGWWLGALQWEGGGRDTPRRHSRPRQHERLHKGSTQRDLCSAPCADTGNQAVSSASCVCVVLDSCRQANAHSVVLLGVTRIQTIPTWRGVVCDTSHWAQLHLIEHSDAPHASRPLRHLESQIAELDRKWAAHKQQVINTTSTAWPCDRRSRTCSSRIGLFAIHHIWRQTPCVCLFSVLCWLGVRKSIQPVKIEWWGIVVVIYEQGADCYPRESFREGLWNHQRKFVCLSVCLLPR